MSAAASRSAAALGIPWRPVVALTGVATVLLVAAALWPASAFAAVALKLSLPLLAGATAYLLDEGAAEAAAAAPVHLRARSSMRLAVAAGPLLAGTLALLALGARAESGVVPGVVVPLLGCILIACGASAVARRSVAEPGDAVAGAIIAAFAALSLVNPLARWVDLFPTREGQRWGGSLALWAVFGVVSVVLVALATRDPLD